MSTQCDPSKLATTFLIPIHEGANIMLRVGNVGSDNTGAPDLETLQSTSSNGNYDVQIKDF